MVNIPMQAEDFSNPGVVIYNPYWATEDIVNPSHASIRITVNATAAVFICKIKIPTPVQVKKIIKKKIGDI